jgi:hypothetical protein
MERAQQGKHQDGDKAAHSAVVYMGAAVGATERTALLAGEGLLPSTCGDTSQVGLMRIFANHPRRRCPDSDTWLLCSIETEVEVHLDF